jgi:dTDP-4-amino-4,6-dideoxygalactose transaminase
VSNYPAFKIFKKSNLPVAEQIAKNILCIPLYHDLTDEQIQRVVNSIYSLHMKPIGIVKPVQN